MQMPQRPKRDAYGKAKSPWFPDLVLRIVIMRDIEEKSFEEIAQELEMTRANASNQRARWLKWAVEQPAYKEALAKKRRSILD